MGGPLIYFQETDNSNTSAIGLAGNTFNLIHGYLATNIIQIRRTIVPINSEDLVIYFTFGGRILFLENEFSDIAGCPSVDVSLVSIEVSNTYYRESSTIPAESSNPYLDKYTNGESNLELMQQVFTMDLKFETKSIRYKGKQIDINPIIT